MDIRQVSQALRDATDTIEKMNKAMAMLMERNTILFNRVRELEEINAAKTTPL